MAMVVRLIGLLAACAVALPFLGASAQKTDDLLVDGSGDSELYPEQGELESGGMSEEQINSLFPDAPSYFEGDIVLTKDQQFAIEDLTRKSFDRHAPQRAITRKQNGLWSNGKVPYVIASNLGSKARSAIKAAISEYSARTCIDFSPRRSEGDYVYFFKGTGCYSNVGRVGGLQKISIGSGCEYKGTVMHEMFHALGRWHEQSRPDREQFISINYNNMRDGVAGNFVKLSTSQVKTQGVKYDYGSIMHYSAYAFSTNGKPTIQPKDTSVSIRTLGQRVRLSTRDLEHISALYCDKTSTASWSRWGSWNTCSRTCNGGTRYRSRTCQGGSNCPGSSSHQVSCNTQSCSVSASWSAWGSWSGCSRTCGGGRQDRTRQCINGNTCSGATTQYRNCNTRACPDTTGVPVADIKHEGCYLVQPGYGLFLLDNRANGLKDNPFQRSQPVDKCAKAASDFSYSVMGVAAGYCISGNNKLSSYTRTSANQCKDGKGTYSNRLFYMDVYSLSITQPADSTVMDSTADEQELTPSSGTVQGSSAVWTVLLSTLCLLYTLTPNLLHVS